MRAYRGISRNEYWMMRGEPTYVLPTPEEIAEAAAAREQLFRDRDPGFVDPDQECYRGHAHCYRH